MIRVTLNSENGESLSGSLRTLKGPPAIPHTLNRIIRSGFVHVGCIRTSIGDLFAVYTIEAPGKDEDFETRKAHYAWMRARGAKPGDIQGCATDEQGTHLYRFHSE
jgi:hypothetical protein